MILIIDNYDSFTQNLVQYVGELGFSIKVVRNDEIALDNIEQIQPTHIIISPGPGSPTDSGISLNVIKHYAHSIPILGVCLGHQSIGYVNGAEIEQLNKPMHGKITEIYHDSSDLFSKLPNPFYATRYHSLIIRKINLPQDIIVTAWTYDGTIMACRHRKHNFLRGIQFHPESLWTNHGKLIIENFLFS
uniref:Anthranilate synthase component 2 n=1 Tax=Ahnfeltia plicata TaxID=28023 RepID=A0A1C9CB41_9FLOR|nr:anthranilate synthase component 2 [Ahnfeltia plicata]AOM65620.1 anthranilate synthase component 2 [Ahnfeltia plicata]UAT97195.1 anthranilate synthase component 2 [Ahnfeltia plicata]UAT97400.1 anthranilate synthase component 2 [Ahnfeltia plicata]